MGRRWKWFLRPWPVVIDQTGQATPDGNVPGRYRRLTTEHVVPDLEATSRCDGATVYQRPGEARTSRATNQRATGYPPKPPGTRNQGRH